MSKKPSKPPLTFQLAPIRNRIAEFRETRELSQYFLAFHLGISRQALQAIEKGKVTPNLATAFRIAKYFERNIEDIFQCDITDEDFEVIEMFQNAKKSKIG